MIGSTVIFEYHEMCYPYHIACFHTHKQLTNEELEAEMCKVLGWDEMDDWHRHSLKFIDHNRLRGLTILGEEIDPDIIRALKRFFPESLKGMGGDQSFGNFSYQYYDAKANEVIWMNLYQEELQECLHELQKASAILYQERRSREKEERKNDESGTTGNS
ncbi:hypothetical protein pEaSNUABM50_00430 [Erwinia phage pEa_SNUABM_50]|uniref:Uncharacterized protein n=1 Tax=Erwinia phage pEa_SNUABM_50 TaxID=2768775 RepID=A0A7L8ZPL9_9CAUD|nr:hypothetical protein pEaSNUABM50_00430 [Erwinia phage pEa_SNUABM_50]